MTLFTNVIYSSVDYIFLSPLNRENLYGFLLCVSDCVICVSELRKHKHSKMLFHCVCYIQWNHFTLLNLKPQVLAQALNILNFVLLMGKVHTYMQQHGS